MTQPLDPEFQARIDQWKQVASNQADHRQQSDDFYRTEIFPHVRELFVKQAKEQSFTSVEGLILPVGTSPEPLILSISALQPKKVMFLPTPQTLEHIDRIVEDTGLRPSQYKWHQIDGSDALDIYRCIRDTIKEWSELTSIGIDITAGKKVMAAAASVAGIMIKATLFYVDNTRFLPQVRRPEPGTEYLAEIPNPLEVFGVLEAQEARQLFNSGDYEGAAERWEKLSGGLKEIEQATLSKLSMGLAKTYAARDQLLFGEALTHATEIHNIIQQHPSLQWLAHDKLSLVKIQIAQLQQLNALTNEGKGASPKEMSSLSLLQNQDQSHVLVREFYAYARRRDAQQQNSMATLIYYRLAELLAQRRLATYNIDTSDPDYTQLALPMDELLEATNKQRTQLKMTKLAEMPDKISLMDAYILLCVLKDPFTQGLILGKFNGLMSLRNSSIFAHGFKFVTRQNLESIRKELDERLKAFWAAEGVQDADAQRDQEQHTFICM